MYHDLRNRRAPRDNAIQRRVQLRRNIPIRHELQRHEIRGQPALPVYYNEPLIDRIGAYTDYLGFAGLAAAPLAAVAGVANYYWNRSHQQAVSEDARFSDEAKARAQPAQQAAGISKPLTYLLLVAKQHMLSAKYGRSRPNYKPKNGGSQLRNNSEAKDQSPWESKRSQLPQRSYSGSLGQGSQLESAVERREFPLSTSQWRRQHPTTDIKHVVSDDEMELLERFTSSSC